MRQTLLRENACLARIAECRQIQTFEVPLELPSNLLILIKILREAVIVLNKAIRRSWINFSALMTVFEGARMTDSVFTSANISLVGMIVFNICPL